jgi:ribonucleoside-triphosphate reductase
VYESQGDEVKFAEILDGRLEMTSRAFDIKHAAVKQHGEKLLPFLMQNTNGDQYFRLTNSLRLVNFVGFKEMLEAIPKKTDSKDAKAVKRADSIIHCIAECARRSSRKGRRRLFPVMLPDDEASERLAQLDVDRYGLGKVKYSGSREKPFYSTVRAYPFDGNNTLTENSQVEHDFRSALEGGCLSVIDLGDDPRTPDELCNLSMHIAEKGLSEFFTYDRKLTYCSNCRKSWFGTLAKCPSCGSVGTLVAYDRFPLARIK